MPELGTGIEREDCMKAMRKLIHAGSNRSVDSWGGWNEGKVFISPPHIAVFPQVQFDPQQETHGTCHFSVVMNKAKINCNNQLAAYCYADGEPAPRVRRKREYWREIIFQWFGIWG